MAVTQSSWLDTLQAVGCDGQVNFWRPSTAGVAERLYGLPLVFVRKGHEPREVSGYGFICGFELLSVEEAWSRWRYHNGVTSLPELRSKIEAVARQTATNSGSRWSLGRKLDLIGCVVLEQVQLFSPTDSLTVDDMERLVGVGFPRNTVSYKVFSEDFPLIPLHGVAKLHSQRAQEELREIEVRAMKVAIELLRGWEVHDVSTPLAAEEILGKPHPGYDLIAENRNGERLNIEVKGTKSVPPTVTLSTNELRTAATDERARLLVVSGVRTSLRKDRWMAEGGDPTLLRWRDPATLVRLFADLASLTTYHVDLQEGGWRLDSSLSSLLANSPLTS